MTKRETIFLRIVGERTENRKDWCKKLATPDVHIARNYDTRTF